jgi:hypothetical protein
MKVLDQATHATITICGLLPVVAYPIALWAHLLAGFLFALTREDAQHRPEEGWSWPLHGSGGRWWDMFWGTAGGLVTWGLARFLL